MPEQSIIYPNCTNGCKLIKQCFIGESGGGREGYRSNINKCLGWFVLNRLNDTEVCSLLSSPSLWVEFCVCVSCVSSSPLLPWCIECKNKPEITIEEAEHISGGTFRNAAFSAVGTVWWTTVCASSQKLTSAVLYPTCIISQDLWLCVERVVELMDISTV